MRLYDYNKLTDFTDINLTPKAAILFKCHECCCFDGKEVKACKSKDCPLYKLKEKWYKIPRSTKGKKTNTNRFIHKKVI